LFGKLFPGGFGGKTFLKEERGIPGVTEKSGDKEALIALAQSELSRERFETAAPEALFESAKKVLQGTTIIFPMEGTNSVLYLGRAEPRARARGPETPAPRRG
jgi:hypothetical protein